MEHHGDFLTGACILVGSYAAGVVAVGFCYGLLHLVQRCKLLWWAQS